METGKPSRSGDRNHFSTKPWVDAPRRTTLDQFVFMFICDVYIKFETGYTSGRQLCILGGGGGVVVWPVSPWWPGFEPPEAAYQKIKKSDSGIGLVNLAWECLEQPPRWLPFSEEQDDCKAFLAWPYTSHISSHVLCRLFLHAPTVQPQGKLWLQVAFQLVHFRRTSCLSLLILEYRDQVMLRARTIRYWL